MICSDGAAMVGGKAPRGMIGMEGNSQGGSLPAAPVGEGVVAVGVVVVDGPAVVVEEREEGAGEVGRQLEGDLHVHRQRGAQGPRGPGDGLGGGAWAGGGRGGGGEKMVGTVKPKGIAREEFVFVGGFAGG